MTTRINSKKGVKFVESPASSRASSREEVVPPTREAFTPVVTSPPAVEAPPASRAPEAATTSRRQQISIVSDSSGSSENEKPHAGILHAAHTASTTGDVSVTQAQAAPIPLMEDDSSDDDFDDPPPWRGRLLQEAVATLTSRLNQSLRSPAKLTESQKTALKTAWADAFEENGQIDPSYMNEDMRSDTVEQSVDQMLRALRLPHFQAGAVLVAATRYLAIPELPVTLETWRPLTATAIRVGATIFVADEKVVAQGNRRLLRILSPLSMAQADNLHQVFMSHVVANLN